jgi:hypothetical protein
VRRFIQLSADCWLEKQQLPEPRTVVGVSFSHAVTCVDQYICHGQTADSAISGRFSHVLRKYPFPVPSLDPVPQCFLCTVDSP